MSAERSLASTVFRNADPCRRCGDEALAKRSVERHTTQRLAEMANEHNILDDQVHTFARRHILNEKQSVGMGK